LAGCHPGQTLGHCPPRPRRRSHDPAARRVDRSAIAKSRLLSAASKKPVTLSEAFFSGAEGPAFAFRPFAFPEGAWAGYPQRGSRPMNCRRTDPQQTPVPSHSSRMAEYPTKPPSRRRSEHEIPVATPISEDELHGRVLPTEDRRPLNEDGNRIM